MQEYLPFGDTYGPLNVGKIGYYPDRLHKVLDGNPYDLIPVTVHLVPTMRCTHRCYFCTYGGAKERQAREQTQSSVLDMPLEMIIDTIGQLARAGVQGIIFTGGGEPTLYKGLIQAMGACKTAQIDFSLNTNGSGLTDDFIHAVMPLEPVYIRVSLNSGSTEVQKLITGANDFEQVLNKIERLMYEKISTSAKTTIAVAFAVEILNLYDIKKLVDRLVEIEKRVRKITGVKCPITMVVRPVSNYENSKHYDETRIKDIVQYLKKRGTDDEGDFLSFMYESHQCTAKHLDIATNILDKDIRPALFAMDTGVNVFYPSQKFQDLPRVKEKRYTKCFSTSWFLFIWPDGTVYPCVEWAGTPGFEIGTLKTQTLAEILSGSRRKEVCEWINDAILHTRCAPICAHHEMNSLLARVSGPSKNDDRTQLIDSMERLSSHSKPQDVSFI